jgi:hypothetical protein
MPNAETIAMLNEAVDVNNSKLFGFVFRQEVYHYHLYRKNNEKEFSDLIEYVKNNYSEKYFKESIKSLTDFLFTHQILDEDGEFELQLNSFCQSLMVSGKIKDRIQSATDFLFTHQMLDEDGEFELQLIKDRNQSAYDLSEVFKNIDDMYNVIFLDKEISIRRSFAIVTFVCLLGFISRKACQQYVEGLYFRETCRQGRFLYHSIESYADAMIDMRLRNGDKDPTLLNFWFVFSFRVVVWGLLALGFFKLIGVIFK